MAPGPVSVLSSICLATLGGYGLWTASDLPMHVPSEIAIASESVCTTAACVADTLATDIEGSAIDSRRQGRPSRQNKEEHGLPLHQKILVVFVMFSFEAAFLYCALSHLKVPRHRRWQSPNDRRRKGSYVRKDVRSVGRGNFKIDSPEAPCPLAGDAHMAEPETLDGEEDLPEDLSNQEPTLRPECRDLDSRMPSYGDTPEKESAGQLLLPTELSKETDEITQEGQPGSASSELADKGRWLEDEDKVMQAASPLRRRTKKSGKSTQAAHIPE